MTTALVLAGRSTASSSDALATHARRLRERGVTDVVTTLEYDHDPVAELPADLDAVDAERVFVSPFVVEREHFPARDLDAATGKAVTVCEPVGWSPAVTDAVLDRAAEHVSRPDRTTLVVVGLGRSSASDRDLAAAYHTDRVRTETAYDQVLEGYLLQNPAVECVGYDVDNESVVVVPLFPSACEATDERLPDALGFEPDALTAPLGRHPSLTDAVEAEFARQEVLSVSPSTSTDSSNDGRRLAADGTGGPSR